MLSPKAGAYSETTGIGSVVFAHKTTEGWEALLIGNDQGRMDYHRLVANRDRDGDRAFALASLPPLATSVHLICRPRPEEAEIGDWGESLQGASKSNRRLDGATFSRGRERRRSGLRLHRTRDGTLQPLLQSRGCRRAAKSRLVETRKRAEPYKRGFLAYVWETVGRIALEQILGTAEARARNGAAGALEEDARLTALFLWTIQSTATNGAGAESDEEGESEDEDEEAGAGKSKKGLTLVYDVARRFAQPLGIHLDRWEDRIIVIEKGIVRLLPVIERAEQLLGEDGAIGAADLIERTKGKNINYEFAFAGEVDERPSKPKAKTRKADGARLAMRHRRRSRERRRWIGFISRCCCRSPANRMRCARC